MNRLLCGAFAVALMGLPAGAADIARPMPVKAPVAAPVYSWAGWYGGVHAGYGWDPASGSFDPIAYVDILAPGVSGGGTVLSGPGSIPLSVDPKGGFGGFQFGYNWQNGALVYGWEADFSFGRIKATDDKAFLVTTLAGDVFDFSGNVKLEQTVNYFGTLRGRLGWANDRLLLFATGGLAWGQVETNLQVYNVQVLANGAASPAEEALVAAGAQDRERSFRFGYAVGGGGEWAFTSAWSVRGEYVFIDLGKGDGLAIPGGSADSRFYMHTARLALNFKFAP
jgi:outer membrane immunogenic protein